MKKLLQLFVLQQSIIMMLILFLVSLLVTSTAWANGDWEYDCPKVECPEVNVKVECPCTKPAVPMAAEEPEKHSGIKLSGGLRLGYHAYTANEFLNGLEGLDQHAFNSPSSDQPMPPIEGEFNVSFMKYFSISALVGTYLGKATDPDGAFSSTQTVYFMAMPRFDFSFDLPIEALPITINPYIGAGIGGAWFSFWQDDTNSVFPILDAIDESHIAFAYGPSIGFDVPLLKAVPDAGDVLPPEAEPYKDRLKLLVDYRYIEARYKTFNAGGHLFLVGLGMDF